MCDAPLPLAAPSPLLLPSSHLVLPHLMMRPLITAAMVVPISSLHCPLDWAHPQFSWLFFHMENLLCLLQAPSGPYALGCAPLFPTTLRESELIENDRRRIILHLDELQQMQLCWHFTPVPVLTFNLARHQLTLHQLFRRLQHSTDASAHFSALTFADMANSFYHFQSGSSAPFSWTLGLEAFRLFRHLSRSRRISGAL